MTRMRSRASCSALAAALLCWVTPSPVHAQPARTGAQAGDASQGRQRTVNVRVVEIAGGRAYVEPGADTGLRAGQEVTIEGERFRVIAVESAHAVVELGDERLREGARGSAEVRVRSAAGSPLEPPIPLSDFEGQWTEATRPASEQSPARVPLGQGAGQGRYRVTVLGGAATVVPLADQAETWAHVSLGARMHAEPWHERPFAFDADVALSLWLGAGLDADLGADSRPLLRVRELAARYGDATTPLVAGLGRLRHAATTVGLLDGVRLVSPSLGNVRVSAFGGTVPHTLDGAPALDHGRFGVETTYHDPRSDWQPFVTVVAHGSMFDGALDERRLSTYASAFRGPMAVTGYAEISMFDSDNPWGAAPVELTAAGVDTSMRFGNARVGARLDMRSPERSYWLASILPQSWLCTAAPQPPGTPEPCNGNRDIRYAAATDARIDLGRMAVSAGATVIRVSSGGGIEAASAFADLRFLELLGSYRAHVGLFGGHSAFLDTVALRAGAGGPVPFVEALDLALFYRPSVLRYSASLDDVLDHRFGADVVYTPAPRLDVALTLEAMAGEVSALGAFATAVWRPRI